MMPKGRSIDTDIMRIISCFCVILIHMVTSEPVKNMFPDNTVNIINVLCRFSVPVFIIISGKYMLNRKYNITIIVKKCLILFLEMLIVSMIYLLFDTILYDNKINSFGKVISMVLTTPIHLWYIYSIMTLYLFTPIMYVFVKNATKNELAYAIITCFILGSAMYIPLKANGFMVIKDIFNKCHLEGNLTFIACYLLGHYFEQFSLSKKEKITIYFFGILGLSVSVYVSNSIFVSKEMKTIMLSFFAPNVISQSIMFYIITMNIVARAANRFTSFRNNKTIGVLAQTTYGVYLWHILAKDLLMLHLFDNVSTFGMIFLICIMIFFVCASVVLVHNHIIEKLKE